MDDRRLAVVFDGASFDHLTVLSGPWDRVLRIEDGVDGETDVRAIDGLAVRPLGIGFDRELQAEALVGALVAADQPRLELSNDG